MADIEMDSSDQNSGRARLERRIESARDDFRTAWSQATKHAAAMSRAAHGCRTHMGEIENWIRERRERAEGLLAPLQPAESSLRSQARQAFAVARLRRVQLVIAILYYRLRWWVLGAALAAGATWVVWNLWLLVKFIYRELLVYFEDISPW